MIYLELARARRPFLWCAILLVGFAALVGLGIAGGAHARFGVSTVSPGETSSRVITLGSLAVVNVPAAVIEGLAILACLMLATTLATSFDRETGHAPLAFVRPRSRVRMALDIVAVDVGAVVAIGVVATLLTLLVVALGFGTRARIVGVAPALAAAALGLGATVLWYGLLQAASARGAGRGGGYAIVAAVALVVAPVLAHQPFSASVATLAGIVLVVDPLAYLTGPVTGARILEVWSLAIAVVAFAIALWRRVEI